MSLCLVLFGWCCAWCMLCDNAKRLGKSVPMYCIFSYFCPPCSLYSLRNDTRERYGIEVCILGPGHLMLRIDFLRKFLRYFPLNPLIVMFKNCTDKWAGTKQIVMPSGEQNSITLYYSLVVYTGLYTNAWAWIMKKNVLI